MNPFTPLSRSFIKSFAAMTWLATSSLAFAVEAPSTVDDFSDPQKNTLGIDRLFLDDTTAGGQTSTQHTVENGILSASGTITPPRGQPGWVSTILLLDPTGASTDLSSYQGIRLLIRITKGNLSISANSSEITNFDYHAAPLIRKGDNDFHEVKIPFSSMKRTWSEQTTLNPKNITGLSITAYDLQKGSFEFQIDEVGFY